MNFDFKLKFTIGLALILSASIYSFGLTGTSVYSITSLLSYFIFLELVPTIQVERNRIQSVKKRWNIITYSIINITLIIYLIWKLQNQNIGFVALMCGICFISIGLIIQMIISMASLVINKQDSIAVKENKIHIRDNENQWNFAMEDILKIDNKIANGLIHLQNGGTIKISLIQNNINYISRLKIIKYWKQYEMVNRKRIQ